MRQERFFEEFGDIQLWKKGAVGRQGFTIEELYQKIKERLIDELWEQNRYE
jgi:hypothetical protein